MTHDDGSDVADVRVPVRHVREDDDRRAVDGMGVDVQQLLVDTVVAGWDVLARLHADPTVLPPLPDLQADGGEGRAAPGGEEEGGADPESDGVRRRLGPYIRPMIEGLECRPLGLRLTRTACVELHDSREHPECRRCPMGKLRPSEELPERWSDGGLFVHEVRFSVETMHVAPPCAPMAYPPAIVLDPVIPTLRPPSALAPTPSAPAPAEPTPKPRETPTRSTSMGEVPVSKFTEEEKIAACDRVEKGERGVDVAASIGIGKSQLSRWRMQLGREKLPRGPKGLLMRVNAALGTESDHAPRTTADELEAVRRVEAGQKVAVVAKAYGVSPASLYKWRKKHGRMSREPIEDDIDVPVTRKAAVPALGPKLIVGVPGVDVPTVGSGLPPWAPWAPQEPVTLYGPPIAVADQQRPDEPILGSLKPGAFADLVKLAQHCQSGDEIVGVMFEIANVLLEKNRKYGDSALNPRRWFSKSDSVEQIRVRIDDKLNRLVEGDEEEDEDVELDTLGYLVLLRIARAREAA